MYPLSLLECAPVDLPLMKNKKFHFLFPTTDDPFNYTCHPLYYVTWLLVNRATKTIDDHYQHGWAQ